MIGDTTYLCLVISRFTGEQLAEYQVTVGIYCDWYHARHRAADMFREERPEIDGASWYVDSVEVEA